MLIKNVSRLYFVSSKFVVCYARRKVHGNREALIKELQMITESQVKTFWIFFQNY